jgi:rhodanese-related sulfurtransferase
MMRSSIILLAVLSILSFGTYSQQQIDLVTPQQFQSLIKSQKGMLLDVRTPSEYKKGYIEGAVLMNIFDDDFEARLDKLDKNQVYYVYCASGGRSAECVDIMKRKGFKKVYDLDGGISRWMREKYPVKS